MLFNANHPILQRWSRAILLPSEMLVWNLYACFNAMRVAATLIYDLVSIIFWITRTILR